jgi:hypothetical protein
VHDDVYLSEHELSALLKATRLTIQGGGRAGMVLRLFALGPSPFATSCLRARHGQINEPSYTKPTR